MRVDGLPYCDQRLGGAEDWWSEETRFVLLVPAGAAAGASRPLRSAPPCRRHHCRLHHGPPPHSCGTNVRGFGGAGGWGELPGRGGADVEAGGRSRLRAASSLLVCAALPASPLWSFASPARPAPFCRYIIFNLAMSGGRRTSLGPTPCSALPTLQRGTCSVACKGAPAPASLPLVRSGLSAKPFGHPQIPLAMWTSRSWPSHRSTRCGTVCTVPLRGHATPADPESTAGTRLPTSSQRSRAPHTSAPSPRRQVDYVRVYQNASALNLGCSPPDYPTQQYLAWWVQD